MCPGWRVHDVVAHVAHDYIRKLSGARDGQPMAGPRPGESLPAFLARVNQEFVDTAASWSPRVLIDLIGHLGPQLDELWAARDLDRLGMSVSWAAPDVPAPVWLDVAREYTESWVHQQQVRDAVGRPGADDARDGRRGDRHVPAGGALHAAEAAGGGRHRGAHPGDRPGRRGLDGAAGRKGSGRWTAAQRPRRPRRAVEISADGLWRVATRGITVDAALRQATITGDQALGAAVLSLVSIIR